MDRTTRILAERAQSVFDSAVEEHGPVPVADTRVVWSQLLETMAEDLDLDPDQVAIGLAAGIEMTAWFQRCWINSSSRGELRFGEEIAVMGATVCQAMCEVLAAGIIEIIEQREG